MSKSEMRELARRMERYPESFKIVAEESAEKIACGIEYDDPSWPLIIEALRIAGREDVDIPVVMVPPVTLTRKSRSAAIFN